MEAITRAPVEARPGSAATFLYRTVSLIVRPDRIDAFQAAVRAMADRAGREERGTALFASFQDAANPGSFLIVTVFADERAEHAHRTSHACLEFEQTMQRLTVTGPRIQAWIPGAGLW